MSKSLAIGRHASSRSAMARDEIDAALHQNPALANAAALQFLSQREAARRVIPEQIVGNEDVVAHGGEVIGDRFDRSLANRAGVQLPDRAERTAERAAARGLDQPDRSMREARVFACASRRPAAGSGAAPRRARACPSSPPVRTVAARVALMTSPGTSVSGSPLLERAHETRHGALAVVDHDGRDVGREKRIGVRRRGVTADRRSARRETPGARAPRVPARCRSRAHACRQCRRAPGRSVRM